MPGMRTTGVTDKLTGIGGNAIRSSRSVGTLSAHSQPCIPPPSVSRRIGTNEAGRERCAASNVHSKSTNEGRSSDTGRIRLCPILPAFVGIAIRSKFVTRPVAKSLEKHEAANAHVCDRLFSERGEAGADRRLGNQAAAMAAVVRPGSMMPVMPERSALGCQRSAIGSRDELPHVTFAVPAGTMPVARLQLRLVQRRSRKNNTFRRRPGKGSSSQDGVGQVQGDELLRVRSGAPRWRWQHCILTRTWFESAMLGPCQRETG